MDERFSKSYRLLSKSDFENLKKGSERYFSHPVLYFFKINNLSKVKTRSRVGFSISKKMGNACKRNFYKRLLRERFRKSFPLKNLGYDFLVVLVKQPKNSEELLHSFDDFMTQICRRSSLENVEVSKNG